VALDQHLDEDDHPDGRGHGVGQVADGRPPGLHREGDERDRVRHPPGERGEAGEPMHDLLTLDEVGEREPSRGRVPNQREVREDGQHRSLKFTTFPMHITVRD
jgi:hypothetical protein